MSDKSFGDHMNRNIVKNPLLSSAVTGLSLEDLTHKAILLPATTQEQVTRLDQSEGSQPRTLAHADHDKPRFPSGDTFTNISLSSTLSNTPTNVHTILDRQNNEKTHGTATVTQSKATVKSEDDFDVNEYIARLHGTRYVSAPLNSHLKEDQNANLDAEESLEEINLNERQEPELQQSLTADIAQNFSQLPTVLPHVASAVFSSFSNMLMRSREQTPEDAKTRQGQDQLDIGVPLMGVDESAPKDFGLPPKEPPISGTSSYRITSKKKYAQIPGLSYGTQNMYQNTPQASNMPPIMTPSGNVDKTTVAHEAKDIASHNVPSYFIPTENEPIKTVETDKTAITSDVNIHKTVAGNDNGSISVSFYGTDSKNSNVENTGAQDKDANVFPPKDSQTHFTPIEHKDITTPRLPIIPPPPMFSNPRKENQPVGKAVLPPSVARRISANQPIIKPQIVTPSFSENIFIPATVSEIVDPIQPSGIQLSQSIIPDIKPPSSGISVPFQTNPVSFFTPEMSSSGGAPFFNTPEELHTSQSSNPDTRPSMPPLPSNISAPTSSKPVAFEIPSAGASFFTPAQKPSTETSIFTSNTAAQAFGVTEVPKTLVMAETLPSTHFVPRTIPNIGSNAANFTVSSVPPSVTPGPSNAPTSFVPMFTPTQPPSTFFSPSQAPDPQPQMPSLTPEPAKPISPPLATGKVNFRMTKKRPQYYAGPIEGVGDISNNVKPILAPVVPSAPSVDAKSYQGSLFTPDKPQTAELFTAPIVEASVPFDISRPTELLAPYTQFEAKPQPPAPYEISQQGYGQEYNTVFDLSRPTTEVFEAPKQEVKGFGIIGSLKSKLSSIDINKIQSTVTTFFDPAYNDTKSEPALETAPYTQQQYGPHSQEQSNFEIMVPNVDQNQYIQYGYQHGHRYDQENQYYQAQNAYNYAQNERQNTSMYFAQQMHDTSNTNTQYSSVPTNYTQENIPQNIEDLSSHKVQEDKNIPAVSFFNPVAIQGHSQLQTEIVNSQPSFLKPSGNIDAPYVNPNIGTHGAIGDVVKTSINPHLNPTNPLGNQQTSLHLTDPVPKAMSFFDNPASTGELFKAQDDTVFTAIKDSHFSAPLPPAMSFFESPSLSADESKKKTDELVDEMEKLAMAEEIAIASSPFQAVNMRIGVDSKVIETSSVISKAFGPNIATIAQDKNIANVSINKEYEIEQQGKSLIESLSKDTMPIVAVSSVPLFGLSAIIAEKTQDKSIEEKECKILPLLDAHKEIQSHSEKSSLSFFENASEEAPSTVGLSITDVKNVLLMEPPQENLGAILKRNASSSLLKDLPQVEAKIVENLSQDRDSSWNLDTAIVTSKNNVNVSFDKQTSGFFDHLLSTETETTIQKGDGNTTEQAFDFDICGTCREVNPSIDRETDNVTRQLINNINSSIQLSNPVEARLTENNPTADERAFETVQFDAINQITEDTIETLQGQAATDLLDNAQSNQNYGWSTEQLAYASIAAIDQDLISAADKAKFDFKDDTFNTSLDAEYTFKIDPNAIGFFGDNSLFFDNVPNNASDEIKAEFKTHEDVVPRQMNMPTAPPAEEDTKSDETGGLDVLSIEQDAKKDFPLEEEFIIEPSETDDDKIEFRERKKSSEDSAHDTFADRIEKFQNKTGPDSEHDDVYKKSLEYVSPTRSMASYFDTGNYAVETHYRNSLTSPTNVDAFQKSTNINYSQENEPIHTSQKAETETFDTIPTFKERIEVTDGLENREKLVLDEAFRLPPGFEDELRKQYNEYYHNSDKNKEPFIPETSTQTRTTTTPTYATAHGNYTIAGYRDKPIFGAVDNKYEVAKELIAGVKTDTETVSGPLDIKTTGILAMEHVQDNINVKTSNPDDTPTLAKAFGSKVEEHPLFGSNIVPTATKEPVPENMQQISSINMIFGSNITSIPNTKASVSENTNRNVLPDPINFFSNIEEPKPATEPESFNRLASYFSMPPAQPDHSKSFFELSQSQNHYRHDADTNHNIQQRPDNPSQGQVLSKTQENIQNLMLDLTSTQNINFFEDTVKIVNHFSVEYDTEPGFSQNEQLTNTNVKNIEKIEIPKSNLKQTQDKDSINIEKELGNSIVHDNSSDKNKIDGSNDIENSIKDNEDSIETINACEYCCNLKLKDVKNFKVKTAADSDTKENDCNMTEKDCCTKKKSVSVDIGNYVDEAAEDGVTVVHENRPTSEYTPVRHHWFYRVDIEDKSVWRGFSATDSNALEHAYLSPELSEDTLIPTDGGRFDVNIIGRLRIAVYWKEKPTNVRRCSWFYKGTTDARYVPYTEAVADKLEEEYHHGMTTGEWHRRLVLPNNELVVMHGPSVMVHFLHGGCADSFSSPPLLLGKCVYRNPPKIRVAKNLRPAMDHLILVVHGAGEYKRMNMLDDQSTSRPRVVRRGHEESEIEDPEPSSIDHLLLLCHGVGSACDMRFRPVEEVVEDFRATSLQLLQSHYRNSYDNGIVSRVEVLPISWHAQLHVGENGVDKRLNKVTLESIPRLRAFTNHTVLDALFYTSPVYHQTIIDTVCFELNRIYNLFKKRNPDFKGGVSLGGHSLGSVILYDLLCHQTPEAPLTLKTTSNKSYLPGSRQPLDKYPRLEFPPAALYALGSPIAIFECIRGVESLGMDFALPTCKNFFNIFHPYDPIAYRIEPLINPLLQDAKPFLIPHHKGRKRMHLELKDTMVRVGADLKQKLIESLRTTWNKWKASPPTDGQLEKVVEEEMEKETLCDEAKEEQINADLTTPAMLGKLNGGRRIDYVLQEAPLEMINEYLFAMSSHVGYWESEDTMLLMLREIYSSLGVEPDCTVPQQSMTVTRTRLDEATIVNEKDNPSTSRGSS